MTTVLKNLVGGLSRQWTKLGQYWRVPNSASITEARQRVGCRVMTQLFERRSAPLSYTETAGAFLGGLRVMAVDGSVLDVPDTQALFQSLWLIQLAVQEQERPSPKSG